MRRAIYAAFAAWPLVMMATLIVMMLGMGADFPSWFMPLWIAGTVLFGAGWILYLWDVWHNNKVPLDKRALWTAVLVFAGPYAMPVYFWFYLRAEATPN